MSNQKHHKRHAITLAAICILANSILSCSAYAESSTTNEWTKQSVRSTITQHLHVSGNDALLREKNRLKNDVDAVAQYLVEILEEEKFALTVIQTLDIISHAKGNQELFVNAITNKLESYNEVNWIRTTAANALGNLGGETATTVLIGFLDDEDYKVRLWAVGGLEKIGTDRAYDAISEFASRQRDEITAKADGIALNNARTALERRDARKENASQTNAVPVKVETDIVKEK